MQPLISFTLIVVFILSNTTSQASPNEPDEPQLNGKDILSELAKERLEDPLSGVVVNRTVTVQGQDFFRFFSMWWHELDENNSYSISIHERPSARWGSEIWVEYRQNRVFHAFLPPARSQTKEISLEAAEIALENIEDNEIERALFQSEDLGPEEM